MTHEYNDYLLKNKRYIATNSAYIIYIIDINAKYLLTQMISN